ncbi:hypothetical protein [Aeromicrobium sp.]|uniref:hypothetical protein n=1 Tax=Aeromicrobium sp. TaxID=1871063 RepID=UPI0025BF3151|nr:hypothetical protein [Aeromicrobium sp.]MCK5891851.1 hypothetical protein [Aeromicrobium sp.]
MTVAPPDPAQPVKPQEPGVPGAEPVIEPGLPDPADPDVAPEPQTEPRPDGPAAH